MISLDKAKQLKELGLKWSPKNGDEYWYNNEPLVFCYECTSIDVTENSIWLPRLDQLIIELESNIRDLWSICQIEKDKYLFIILDEEDGIKFLSDSLENSVADALIYILEELNSLNEC